MFDFILVLLAQVVKSKAVLFWVNDLTEFILQLPALRRIQQAFEHRILHALTVIDTFLCDSAQPPASGGVAEGTGRVEGVLTR